MLAAFGACGWRMRLVGGRFWRRRPRRPWRMVVLGWRPTAEKLAATAVVVQEVGTVEGRVGEGTVHPSPARTTGSTTATAGAADTTAARTGAAAAMVHPGPEGEGTLHPRPERTAEFAAGSGLGRRGSAGGPGRGPKAREEKRTEIAGRMLPGEAAAAGGGTAACGCEAGGGGWLGRRVQPAAGTHMAPWPP